MLAFNFISLTVRSCSIEVKDWIDKMIDPKVMVTFYYLHLIKN